jgi:hypothetical protein
MIFCSRAVFVPFWTRVRVPLLTARESITFVDVHPTLVARAKINISDVIHFFIDVMFIG